MKTIIRIEHPQDGRGLWRSKDEYGDAQIGKHSHFDIISARHVAEHGFPNFLYDAELYNNVDLFNKIRNYNFAFKSLAQLHTALTDNELKECIVKLGFHVLMLTVTDYYESSYQVVYKKSSVTKQEDITFMFM